MVTGFDLLLVAAESAAQSSQPYAYEFLLMIRQAASGYASLVTEAIANRPLQEHEASPVAIILGAAELAYQRGDDVAVREVLRVGTALLAKWPEYLSATERHPTLTFKQED